MKIRIEITNMDRVSLISVITRYPVGRVKAGNKRAYWVCEDSAPIQMVGGQVPREMSKVSSNNVFKNMGQEVMELFST